MSGRRRGDERVWFLDQVEFHVCGCWLWTGKCNPGGYGLTNSGGGRKASRAVLAHRFAYELFVGPIPDGLVLDHVWANGCRHRNCVNWVDHLEPVTNAENMRRTSGLHRPTQCKVGHPFTEENTYVTPSTGNRQCRECRRRAQKERVARNQQMRAAA